MSDIFTAQTRKLTARVDEQLRETRRATSTVLAEDTLAKVEDTRPDGVAPALVPEAVLGAVEGEFLLEGRVGGVTHEAADGMGVQADHEEESEVVGVPEGLEALVADLLVRGGVHEHHDEEHNVASEATGLSVVDLDGQLGTNFWRRKSNVRLG